MELVGLEPSGTMSNATAKTAMQRLIPPILFLICLLHWLWPLRRVFPAPYNLLGLVPVLLGFASGLAGALRFRAARTNILPFKEADRLVTDGPFRYSRNPMYLGLALVLTGSWVLMGSLTPVICVLVFVVVADRWYIRFEERMLQRKFGPEFDAYRARTRRWR